MVFKRLWDLLRGTSRKEKQSVDDYIKTQDDILKMHKATMLVSKTRQPQTVVFSNGEKVTFSHCNVKFDWSKCRT